jgi:hypothetical protein
VTRIRPTRFSCGGTTNGTDLQGGGGGGLRCNQPASRAGIGSRLCCATRRRYRSILPSPGSTSSCCCSCLLACLCERERERPSQSFHSYVAHRNLQTNAKFSCKVPNRNYKNVVRTSFDLQQNLVHREMHRETERQRGRARERVIGLALPSMCNRISCTERETEY